MLCLSLAAKGCQTRRPLPQDWKICVPLVCLVCVTFLWLHFLRLPGLVERNVAIPLFGSPSRPHVPLAQADHVSKRTAPYVYLAFKAIQHARSVRVTCFLSQLLPARSQVHPAKEQIMRAAVLVAIVLLQAAAPAMASFSFSQVLTACVCVGIERALFAFECG